MKIYLAARYTRRQELVDYKVQLHRLGYQVTSRWLDGSHQRQGEAAAVVIENAEEGIPQAEGCLFAADDVEDVLAADMVVCFTERPRSNHGRGGRHVEFGIALAHMLYPTLGKPGLGPQHLVVVGPRENIFHCLPEVEVFPTWEVFLVWLRQQAWISL